MSAQLTRCSLLMPLIRTILLLKMLHQIVPWTCLEYFAWSRYQLKVNLFVFSFLLTFLRGVMMVAQGLVWRLWCYRDVVTYRTSIIKGFPVLAHLPQVTSQPIHDLGLLSSSFKRVEIGVLNEHPWFREPKKLRNGLIYIAFLKIQTVLWAMKL